MCCPQCVPWALGTGISVQSSVYRRLRAFSHHFGCGIYYKGKLNWALFLGQRGKWETANNVPWGHTKCPSEIWGVQLSCNCSRASCCSLFEILSLPSWHCCSTRTQLCSIFLLPLLYPERRGGIRCPFTTLFPKIQDLLRNICSCLCFPTSSRENCFILHTSSRERRKKGEIYSLYSFLSTAWKRLTGMAVLRPSLCHT